MSDVLATKLLVVMAAPPTPSPTSNGGVCPQAPPGMQSWADQVLAWVKWGVLAILAISFLSPSGC
jgi:hypothetical protein